MKTKLPQANVGIFKLEQSSGELKFVRFEKEQNLRNENDATRRNTSYLTTCEGDSGAGQWVNINARSVLVSVFTQGFEGRFGLNGKVEKGACGMDAMLSNHQRIAMGNAATRTTYEKILTWIKRKAEIL